MSDRVSNEQLTRLLTEYEHGRYETHSALRELRERRAADPKPSEPRYASGEIPAPGDVVCFYENGGGQEAYRYRIVTKVDGETVNLDPGGAYFFSALFLVQRKPRRLSRADCQRIANVFLTAPRHSFTDDMAEALRAAGIDVDDE